MVIVEVDEIVVDEDSRADEDMTMITNPNSIINKKEPKIKSTNHLEIKGFANWLATKSADK